MANVCQLCARQGGTTMFPVSPVVCRECDPATAGVSGNVVARGPRAGNRQMADKLTGIDLRVLAAGVSRFFEARAGLGPRSSAWADRRVDAQLAAEEARIERLLEAA